MRVLAAVALACNLAAWGQTKPLQLARPVAPPAARARDVSIDDYRRHLSELIVLVNDCVRQRNLDACDPMRVGPDDRIPLSDTANAPRRLVRYGWLRVLLSAASEPDGPKAKPASNQDQPPVDPELVPLPPPGKLLDTARMRLAADLAATESKSSSATDHTAERKAMQQVLARKEFSDLNQPEAGPSLGEQLNSWLNHLFANADNWRARAQWIGQVLVWGFIAAVCIGLAWYLIQSERRRRIRLVPELHAPAPGAPSARGWQHWLDDAHTAAAAGRFREAVHFVYWAAISRLESRRLWPAERARTPREYLALLAPEDVRQTDLAALTGSFERIWYGGRAAAEPDYRYAEQLATALIGAKGEAGAR